MDKQNLMPTAAQPVIRITTGQLATELAELQEEALSQLGASRLPMGRTDDRGQIVCATDDRGQIVCEIVGMGMNYVCGTDDRGQIVCETVRTGEGGKAVVRIGEGGKVVILENGRYDGDDAE